MKKSKKVDYSSLSVEELHKRLKDFKIELFNLRFQRPVNQLENPSRIRFVKKEVARIFTQLNKRVRS